jgi:hypothetical protein
MAEVAEFLRPGFIALASTSSRKFVQKRIRKQGIRAAMRKHADSLKLLLGSRAYPRLRSSSITSIASPSTHYKHTVDTVKNIKTLALPW